MPTAVPEAHASVLDGCGTLRLDHLRRSTDNLQAALAGLLALAGARLLRPPAYAAGRRWHDTLVDTGNGCRLELVEPDHHDKAFTHLCFSVGDLASARERVLANGARPAEDVPWGAASGHWLFEHPQLGHFEFFQSELRAGAECISVTGTTAAALADVIMDLFPGLSPHDAWQARLGETPAWDSLAHLRVLIAIEQRFEVEIPAGLTADLTDFPSLLRYLEEVRR